MFGAADALEQAERAVDALVSRLDPEVVSASSAMSLVGRIGVLERRLAGLKMTLAGRVADSQTWRHGGDRSAAHWLARQGGTSVAEAVRTLETADRLKELPATTEAVRAGALSNAQAHAVADAAAVAPDDEADLLGVACRESLRGLRDHAARRKQAHLDADAQHEAIRASRHVRFGTDPDGAATMSVRTTADAMAEIKGAIGHFQTSIFERARLAGRRDPFEAYAADALVEMARAAMHRTSDATKGANSKRVPTKVIIRIDHAALARGHAEPGEVCDIPTAGPIPVRQVADVLAEGDAFAAVIVTDAYGQVTTVAHHGHKPVAERATLFDLIAQRGHDVTCAHTSRAPNAFQRTALDWTNSTCTVEGCDLPRQEIDHRNDWARSHHTKLDELDGYCSHHHALKTRQNYQLAPGTGRRRMLAPTGTDPP